MIQSLDETIKKLLVEKVPLNPREVEISFEVPKRDWAAGLTKPTINLYLYDIRENVLLKQTQQNWIVERDVATGASVKRRAPMRIDCSYLITAWTRAVEDEHRLLWGCLATLFEFPELPEPVLVGDLKGQEVPLRAEVAKVDGAMKNAADFWTALDNQLKPFLNYQVTLPLDLARIKQVPGPLVRQMLGTVYDLDEPARREEVHIKCALGGAVSWQDAGLDIALTGARAVLLETGQSALSDHQGFYRFVNIDKGDYTIKIEKEGFATQEKKVKLDGQRCLTLNFALQRN
jgi:hypothetical protein